MNFKYYQSLIVFFVFSFLTIALIISINSYGYENTPGYVCGEKGSMDARIKDCNKEFIYVVNNPKLGIYKKAHWYLVRRDIDLVEFWKDSSNGWIWMTPARTQTPPFKQEYLQYDDASNYCNFEIELDDYLSEYTFKLPQTMSFNIAENNGLFWGLPSLIGQDFWANVSSSTTAWVYKYTYDGGWTYSNEKFMYHPFMCVYIP